MPRYFFHVFGLDETGLPDDEGKDHPSDMMTLEAARGIALSTTPELDAEKVRIRLVDERGVLIVDASIGELSTLYL